MTMVRPVEDEDVLKRLDLQHLEDLRPEFQEKAEILKHKVFQECPVKQMNGRAIDGKILVQLLTMFVDSVNKGAVMDV